MDIPHPDPCRVLLSYAHESPAQTRKIEIFCRFLRSNGIDAHPGDGELLCSSMQLP